MTGSWYSLIAFLASLSICLAATLCTSEEIAQQNLKRLAHANNHLSLDILRQVSGDGKTAFFSPLSLSAAFGMLYLGTKGETAQELRNVLGYENAELPEELVHHTFQNYLTTVSSQDPSAYVLNVANSILLDRNLDVEASYKREAHDVYQASVQDVDFVNDNSRIVQEVNSWVNDKTNGKITKLLDDLDPSTILVILNAVYFKGTWEVQFDPKITIPQAFYNKGLESEAKEVPMMRVTEEFAYTTIGDAQAVELPYKGGNMSMVILLPNKRDGLESLEKDLTLEKLSEMINELYGTKVHVSLPKFKVEYSREMSGDFKSLGANSIFAPGADFTGMTASKNVYVSQVLHKAIVEVNEEGSEAAGVTAIISNRMGSLIDYTPDIIVDHPFLFAIVDRRIDMVVFLGRVTEL